MRTGTQYTIQERPESDVYTTDNGFIGIRQKIRGEETIVLFTVDETVEIIRYLQNCVEKMRKRASNGKGKQ